MDVTWQWQLQCLEINCLANNGLVFELMVVGAEGSCAVVIPVTVTFQILK